MSRREYALLPTSDGSRPIPVQPKLSRPSWLRRALAHPWTWVLAVACGLTLLNIVCLIVREARTLPSSQLEDFQPLNSLPIVQHHAPTTLDERAAVTTMYSDSYARGVATLGHSLRAANTSARLILAYLPSRVSPRALCLARAGGWTPHAVERIPPPHGGHGVFHRFKDQYTKLSIWALDTLGVASAVYLDADTLVRANFDELFDLPYALGAVSDVFNNRRGFVTDFNAGVLVLRPDSAVLDDMRARMQTARYPPRMAEQAFLNLYFGAHAVRLPFVYNGNLAVKQKSPELWGTLKRDMRIVHYTVVKPFSAYAEGEKLVSPEEEREQLDERIREWPMFEEELGWWADAWKGFREERADEIARCEREQR